jgi:hypothetical protein
MKIPKGLMDYPALIRNLFKGTEEPHKELQSGKQTSGWRFLPDMKHWNMHMISLY